LLKIDLLPRHFAVARTNKLWIAIMMVGLIVVTLGWGGQVMATVKNIEKTKTEFEQVKKTADEVRDRESKTQQKRAELQPIADKVDFVEKADTSGEQFWDRFHAINRYIYNRAQISRFAITPPSTVAFDATVANTTECARFVLNLMRCPHLGSISIAGLPAGVPIEGARRARGVSAAAAAGNIALSISAQLVEPVVEPVPAVAGAGAAEEEAAGFAPGPPTEGPSGMPGEMPGS